MVPWLPTHRAFQGKVSLQGQAFWLPCPLSFFPGCSCPLSCLPQGQGQEKGRTGPGQRTVSCVAYLPPISSCLSFARMFCLRASPTGLLSSSWQRQFLVARKAFIKYRHAARKVKAPQNRTPHAIFMHKFQYHTDKPHETGQHPWPGKYFLAQVLTGQKKYGKRFLHKRCRLRMAAHPFTPGKCP